MALLFRINTISKTLTSYCRAFSHSFLPSSAYPRRTLFTNTCSVYFAKKKVDDVKIPKCTDFEQYFKKPKKGEVDKKTPINSDGISTDKGSEKKKPPFQPPIFGDDKTMAPKPRPLTDRKISVLQPENIDQKKESTMQIPTNNRNKPPILQTGSTDKIKSSILTPEMSDKKGSTSKILKDFIDFTPPVIRSDKNNTSTVNSPTQKDQNKSQSSDDYSKTTKEGGSETTSSTIDENNKKRNSNYKWLAAAAVGLFGIGSALLMMKSSTNDVSESIPQQTEVIEEIKDEHVRSPLTLPKKVPYLIVGGGTASWSAFRAIKEKQPNAKVLIVSNETHPPYKRPPLSKSLWLSDKSKQLDEIDQNIYFERSDFYTDPMHLLNEPNGGVSILHNRTAKSLKLCERKVLLNDGTEIEYDQCLLATGSKPRNLLIFQTAPIRIRNKISFFRSLSDFQSIKGILEKSESIAVIGGGYLATEISLALTKYGADKKKLQVYQIFHENGHMGTTLPRYFSDWIKNKLSDYGLFVIPNTQVDSVEMERSKLKLGLLNGKLLVVDHIIVALGSKPDVGFVEMSGLKVCSKNNGIVVNKQLEALPHLYVAGDAACLPGSFGKETEISYDHALASGRVAGENMATGNNKSFVHQSMFSSNVAPEISFECVGLIDSALKTVGVFSNGSNLTSNINNTNKGVIFYVKHDRVVGIVLWNISNKIKVARQVIAEGKKLYDLNEVVQRFEIQE